MANLKIPYLVARGNRDGTRRFYWQPWTALRAQGWKTVPLGADEGRAIAEARRLNAELEAWRRGERPAERDATVPAVGTLDALIAAYKASDAYLAKAPKTRKGYAWAMDILSAWSGDVPVRVLDGDDVKEFHKQLRARTPAKADAVITVLRLVLQFGVPKWRPDNPARMLNLKRHRRRRSEDELWTAADIRAFVAEADRMGLHSVGTAVLLNEWLGQREGDLIALPRAAYKRGEILFQQSKTGARAPLPAGAVPKLKRRIAAELARQKRRKVEGLALILSETTGQAYKEDNFRHVFARIRAEAAKKRPRLAALQFMTLRHTAVVRLAEAGCSIPEIAAITGHSLKSVETILEHYLVRTRQLAKSAFAKRLRGGA